MKAFLVRWKILLLLIKRVDIVVLVLINFKFGDWYFVFYDVVIYMVKVFCVFFYGVINVIVGKVEFDIIYFLLLFGSVFKVFRFFIL